MPATVRWSSSASPIAARRVVLAQAAQEALLVEVLGEDVGAERRDALVEARARLGHQLEHRPVELDDLVAARAQDQPRAPRRAPPALAGAIDAPDAGHAQVRVQGQVVLEAQEQVLAVRVDGAHRAPGEALGPMVARVPGLRRDDLGNLADQHRAHPVGGVVDGVALGHAQALSVSFRGPWRKPSSTSTGSQGEPTTGSPSTRSSESFLIRPRWTCSASAAKAGSQARVVLLDERDDALAAALDVEHRLGADEHDVRARHARGPAALLVVALGPRQRRAVGLGRVGRGEHERRRRLVVARLRAQALDRARQRELRAAQALDEVAAPRDRRASPAARAGRRASRSRRARPRRGPARA